MTAAWNRQGLPWKTWTYPEMLWVVHAQNIEYLRSEKPRELRKYLRETGDVAVLREVDAAALKVDDNAKNTPTLKPRRMRGQAPR